MTAPSIKEALELKPCPFCGGDDIIVADNVEVWGQQSDQVYAHCCKCKANGPSSCTDHVALTKWNTRALATLSPPAGERREAIALRLEQAMRDADTALSKPVAANASAEARLRVTTSDGFIVETKPSGRITKIIGKVDAHLHASDCDKQGK